MGGRGVLMLMSRESFVAALVNWFVVGASKHEAARTVEGREWSRRQSVQKELLWCYCCDGGREQAPGEKSPCFTTVHAQVMLLRRLRFGAGI